MQGIFVVEISNGEKSQENEIHEHPFLEELEHEIAKLERMSAEITMRHAVVSHIRKDLLETLGVVDKPEKSQTKEKIEKEEPVKHEETTEKIDDGEEESLSEPMLKRLKVLEQVAKNTSDKLGNAAMTARFQKLSELHQKFENCLNYPEEKKGTIEHLVEIEKVIGEALDFLATSKLAARFNLLKQLRVELGEALTNSRAN